MRGRFTDQGGLFSYIAPDKRVAADFLLNLIAYNLIRIPKLLVA